LAGGRRFRAVRAAGIAWCQRIETRSSSPPSGTRASRCTDDLRGWDRNLYLGPSEFYNNFGRFDVSIDVPGGWLVSGTGVLQNPEQVYTAKARERLSHVLESNETLTIVGDDEVGPGQATMPGERLVWHLVADQVNDFAWATAKKYTLRATRATVPGQGSDSDLHGAPPGNGEVVQHRG
jgi:hypothetical protein